VRVVANMMFNSRRSTRVGLTKVLNERLVSYKTRVINRVRRGQRDKKVTGAISLKRQIGFNMMGSVQVQYNSVPLA